MITYCRHVRTSGGRCRCRALEGHDFCYHHLSQRKPAASHALELPPIEDRFAVQLAIQRVFAALSAGTLDKRLAGLYLYGIQIAASNLPRDHKPLAPENLPQEDLVDRIVVAAGGEELALAETAIEERDVAGHRLHCDCAACAYKPADRPHHSTCRCGLCHLFTAKDMPSAPAEKTGPSDHPATTASPIAPDARLRRARPASGYFLQLWRNREEHRQDIAELLAGARSARPRIRGAELPDNSTHPHEFALAS